TDLYPSDWRAQGAMLVRVGRQFVEHQLQRQRQFWFEIDIGPGSVHSILVRCPVWAQRLFEEISETNGMTARSPDQFVNIRKARYPRHQLGAIPFDISGLRLPDERFDHRQYVADPMIELVDQ